MTQIFKIYVEMAIAESDQGYDVLLQGRFDKTPIRIEIEVSAKGEIP